MRRLSRIAFDIPTLLLVGAAVLVVAVYWGIVALSEDYYVIDAPAGSVFSSGEFGLKALASYLEALDVDHDTLQSFDELPAKGTIVVAADEPLEREPTPAEVRRLERWVDAGGRLVLMGRYADDALAGASGGSPATGAEAALEPLLPGVYSRGVERVEVGEERLLMASPSWATHLKDRKGQVLVSRATGAGEVVWLATLKPAGNAGIGEADNARLVTLLVASGGPVYFDEYHHGFVRGGGVWDRLGAGGQAAVVLLAAAVVVALLAAARRAGPVIEPAPAHEARTGAYIASLAELYRKAGARAEALASLADALRSALVRRYGDIEAAAAAEPEAVALLERVSSTEEMTGPQFVQAARDIARARREVEGRDGTLR